MIPEFPQFKNLELSDRIDIENFTKNHPPYSDFNFTSMWVWNTSENIQISILNKNLTVKFTDYLTGEYFYSFIGHNDLKNTVEILLSHTKIANIKNEIMFAIHDKIDGIDNIEITPDPDNFDYIYNLEDLSSYSGKKYETLRNLINRFNKRNTNCRTEYIENVHNLKKEILELNKKWVENKKDKVIDAHSEKETKAIERLFDLKDNKNLCATCIYKDEKMVAFIINELIPDSEYVLAHFAKADANIPGIYSYLINNDSKYLLSKGKKYLNYEQDMGLENLRKAKMALNPKTHLKKYKIKRLS